jgi:hypothetical protein
VWWLVLNGCFWSILLKKPGMVHGRKGKRLSLESKIGAEVFGLGFQVAAHKKRLYLSDFALSKPTFSTESARSGRFKSGCHQDISIESSSQPATCNLQPA